jgi:polycystin 2/polycystin 2L1
MIFTSSTITKFTEQKLQFVNFGHIALWDEVLNAFISFLVFLTTLRILRILNYSHNITQLAGVLSNAKNNLMGCFFMFGLIFMAYAGVGYLLFGAHLDTYKNIYVSITTIVNSLIGRNSLHGLIQTAPIIAEIYYFTFIMFVIWIVMTMLNATLNKSIGEIRTNMKKKEERYGIDDLMQNFLQNFWHKINFKFQKSTNNVSSPRTKTSLTSNDVNLLLEDIDAISFNDGE